MDAVRGEARENGATRRPPLVPSERNNAAPAAGRSREVPSTSRCKPVAPPPPAAASPARRCTSPSPGRASAVDGAALPSSRARSADRTRAPAAPPSSRPKPSAAVAVARSASPARGAGAEGHVAPRRAAGAKAPDGLWASARSPSPSPSLQAEPPPVPAPATMIDRLVRGLPSQPSNAQAGAAAERKRSPLRGNGIGNQLDNARPSENSAQRVVVEQHRWPAMTTGRGSAGLTSTSIVPADDKTSRSVSSSNRRSPRRPRQSEATVNRLSYRPPNEMAAKMPAAHRRRREDMADSGSDASSQTSQSSKSACRSSTSASSPVPVLQRSASPSNRVLSAAASSGSKASRHSAPGRRSRGCSCSTAQSAVARPAFDCTLGARKGRKNASRIEDIHRLRLLNNRYLQWRFVNARSEAALSSQRSSVESNLYSVSKSILKMWEAVTMTSNIDMQRLQQKLKLHNILKKQIAYLEQWPVLEEESSKTLLEAIEALKASTLRLPVTSGAQAETVAVKNAVSSAIDVMQGLMTSSSCYLQPKVEDTLSLVSELSVTARQEKVALDECRELIATAGKLQVQEASLCTHLMQLRGPQDELTS